MSLSEGQCFHIALRERVRKAHQYTISPNVAMSHKYSCRSADQTADLCPCDHGMSQFLTMLCRKPSTFQARKRTEDETHKGRSCDISWSPGQAGPLGGL